MQRHGGDGQAGLLPELAHLHQIDEALHVLLHLVQAAQLVQLLQQLLQGGLGLLRGPVLLPGGGSRLLFGGGRGGCAGLGSRELVGPDGGPVGPQAVPVAQLQQHVVAGVDKARLALADHPVHRSEEEQQQGEVVGEVPGQGGALHPVVPPQVGEEGGGLEQVEVGHAGGHLPVQAEGTGLPGVQMAL